MRNNSHHRARVVLIGGKLLQVRKPHVRVVQVSGRSIKNQQVRGAMLRQSSHQLNIHLATNLIHPQAVQLLKTALGQPAARTGTTKNRQVIGEHLRHIIVHAHMLLRSSHIRRVHHAAESTQTLHRNTARLIIVFAPANRSAGQGKATSQRQRERGTLQLAIRLNNNDFTLTH